jgi:hypothetical protein
MSKGYSIAIHQGKIARAKANISTDMNPYK